MADTASVMDGIGKLGALLGRRLAHRHHAGSLCPSPTGRRSPLFSAYCSRYEQSPFCRFCSARQIASQTGSSFALISVRGTKVTAPTW